MNRITLHLPRLAPRWLRLGAVILSMSLGLLLLPGLPAQPAHAQIGDVIVTISPYNPVISTVTAGYNRFSGRFTTTVTITNTGTEVLPNMSTGISSYEGGYQICASAQDLAPGESRQVICDVVYTYAYGYTPTDITAVLYTSINEGYYRYTTTIDYLPVTVRPLYRIEPERQTVTFGQPATMTVVISNTSDSTFTNITVTDTDAPDCARTAGSLPDVLPGQTLTYDCITGPLYSRSHHRASVQYYSSKSGTLSFGYNLTNIIDVTSPLAAALTPAQQLVSAGSPAYFDVTLSNSGRDPLRNVAVEAQDAPDCARAAGSLPDLSPGRSLTYDCQSPAATLDYLNVITVTATDNGSPLWAAAQTWVDVSEAVQITVNPPQRTIYPVGQTVTFTVGITNRQSSANLTDIWVDAPAAPDCARSAGALADLAPGAVHHYTCQTQVNYADVHNAVTVWASSTTFSTDADPFQLAVQASADVNVAFLPVLYNDFGPGPDLVVEDFIATSTGVTVTLKNEGLDPVTASFWVDVYFDPATVPALNQPWPTLAPAGAAWGVTQTLAPEESLTLTTSDKFYIGPPVSSPLPYPVDVPAYVLLDSVNYHTDYGNVREKHEDNNLGGPVTLVEGRGNATTIKQTGSPSTRGGLPER
jgi:hypothetical protein